MGQDHRYQPFHEALLKLVNDPEPMVRRNAALGLTNFEDPAALPVLLQPLSERKTSRPSRIMWTNLAPGHRSCRVGTLLT